MMIDYGWSLILCGVQHIDWYNIVSWLAKLVTGGFTGVKGRNSGCEQFMNNTLPSFSMCSSLTHAVLLLLYVANRLVQDATLLWICRTAWMWVHALSGGFMFVQVIWLENFRFKWNKANNYSQSDYWCSWDDHRWDGITWAQRLDLISSRAEVLGSCLRTIPWLTAHTLSLCRRLAPGYWLSPKRSAGTL